MEGFYGCMVVWVHGWMGAGLYGCMDECLSSASVVHAAVREEDYSPSATVGVFTRLPLRSIDTSSTQWHEEMMAVVASLFTELTVRTCIALTSTHKHARYTLTRTHAHKHIFFLSTKDTTVTHGKDIRPDTDILASWKQKSTHLEGKNNSQETSDLNGMVANNPWAYKLWHRDPVLPHNELQPTAPGGGRRWSS